jgi:hypothetical protein
MEVGSIGIRYLLDFQKVENPLVAGVSFSLDIQGSDGVTRVAQVLS